MEKYLDSNQHSEKQIAEEYQNTAVMFASILNYTDCKADDSDGIDNLKSLNSIITEFDQIVTPFLHTFMMA